MSARCIVKDVATSKYEDLEVFNHAIRTHKKSSCVSNTTSTANGQSFTLELEVRNNCYGIYLDTTNLATFNNWTIDWFISPDGVNFYQDINRPTIGADAAGTFIEQGRVPWKSLRVVCTNGTGGASTLIGHLCSQ